MTGEAMIECTTIYGDKVSVPKDKLVFRPSVYGIIKHDENVLLIKNRHGNKYFLPGGGVEIGEKIEQTLKREVKEETGIEIDMGNFLHFQEDFFYYNPLDEAFHALLFFYRCTPITFDLIPDDEVDDLEASQPRWIPVQNLVADDFQNYGTTILNLIKGSGGEKTRLTSSV